MEPLHVLEQRSGMMKGEVFGGLPGLQDMMVSLTSHQQPTALDTSSLSAAYNNTAVFLNVWLASSRIPWEPRKITQS